LNRFNSLLAAISDIAHPKWWATSLGDLGFAFGAIGIGFIADLSSSIQLVAWIAMASGVFIYLMMKETKKH
jgi:hypothetical protein